MSGETTTAHHPSCIAEQAWDIPEAYDHCTCGTGAARGFPRRVCTRCWRPPKQHLKTCPNRPKKEPR
jgi:hypothetical protein